MVFRLSVTSRITIVYSGVLCKTTIFVPSQQWWEYLSGSGSSLEQEVCVSLLSFYGGLPAGIHEVSCLTSIKFIFLYVTPLSGGFTLPSRTKRCFSWFEIGGWLVELATSVPLTNCGCSLQRVLPHMWDSHNQWQRLEHDFHWIIPFITSCHTRMRLSRIFIKAFMPNISNTFNGFRDEPWCVRKRFDANQWGQDELVQGF